MEYTQWDGLTNSFDLWESHIEHLEQERGIPGLWPPQVNSLEEGALDDENFLMISPPGTGKTLIAEIIAVNEWRESGNPSVYLVPYVALAEEKYTSFDGNLGKLGMDIQKATETDYPNPSDLFGSDIIIMTYEKFDYYLRNYPDHIESINCAIIDEFHTVANDTRGPNLETCITELMKRQPDVRILGLSATIPNADEVNGWLGGSYSSTPDWRYNDLHEGVCLGKEKEIRFFVDEEKEQTYSVNNYHPNYKVNAILDFLISGAESGEGKQALVFAPKRKSTRQTAIALANFIDKHERSLDFGLNRRTLDEIGDRIEAGPDRGQTESELLKCISKGIGFHHAGLSQHAKEVLEDAFDDGHISTIVATTTLAAGVNLPIKRVFVLEPKLGQEEMPVSKYKNLVGRAGRPRLDEPGEAVVFAKTDFTSEPIINKYIKGDIEQFESQINLSEHYGILLNLARQYPTVSGMMDFMGETYLGYSGEVSEAEIGSSVRDAVSDLGRWNMLEFNSDQLYLSQLGRAASKQLINPQTTHLAVRYLSGADELDLFDFLTTLASSPEFDRGLRIWSDSQWSNRDEIQDRLNLNHFDNEEFDKVITTAKIIQDWVQEGNLEDEIYPRYGVDSNYWGTADVHERVVPAFVRTIKSVGEVLEEAKPELDKQFGDELETLRKRIRHGLQEESVPFVTMDIEDNRRRVLDLRERVGISSPDELLETEIQELANQMKDRRARKYHRRTAKKLLDGFERDKELVLLDVREQGLNQETFESVLSTWETNFERCVLNELQKVDSIRVDEVNEDGPGYDPEAYCYIYSAAGGYLGTLDGSSRFEIAIECKSKRELDGNVGSDDATKVLGKGRDESDALVTIGTPSFTEDAKDAARGNDICLLDSPAFVAAMIRMQQGELTPEQIKAFFSQTGYISKSDVYGFPSQD